MYIESLFCFGNEFYCLYICTSPAPSDYTAVSTAQVFSGTTTSVQVTVTIRDDAILEDDKETFSATLESIDSSFAVASSAQVVICDDDTSKLYYIPIIGIFYII